MGVVAGVVVSATVAVKVAFTPGISAVWLAVAVVVVVSPTAVAVPVSDGSSVAKAILDCASALSTSA